MPFQKGNKEGRKSSKQKPFQDRLRAAVNQADGDKIKLDRIAEALIANAIDGDTAAIKEVADRLDGKAVQQNVNENTHSLSDPLTELLTDIAKNGSKIHKG